MAVARLLGADRGVLSLIPHVSASAMPVSRFLSSSRPALPAPRLFWIKT
jgi:hypothetical protein